MASLTPMSHPQSVYKKPHFAQPTTLPHLGFLCFPSRNPNFSSSSMVLGQKLQLGVKPSVKLSSPGMTRAMAADTTSSSSEQKKERYPGESKGFVEEMRFVAMRLHTKDQAREGKKTAEGPEEKSPTMWKPTVEGYLKFLVDSKLVYETLERIVEKASVPYYAEFRNTGLERSEKLEKDLEWFKEQGYDIPEPSEPGRTYSSYLTELSETDPQAFICHFYNVYFAHSAGGRMIGRKVAETLINKKELEFYKWDGDLLQLLQNVRDKLNKVAQSWSREEKNHCLEETEKSFKHSGELLRLILQTAE